MGNTKLCSVRTPDSFCTHQSSRRGVFRTNICLSSSPNPSLHFTYKKPRLREAKPPVQQYRASQRQVWDVDPVSFTPATSMAFLPSFIEPQLLHLLEQLFFFLEGPTIPDHPDTLLNSEAASKVFINHTFCVSDCCGSSIYCF